MIKEEIELTLQFRAQCYAELCMLLSEVCSNYEHPTTVYKAYKYDLIQKLISELTRLKTK